MKCFRGGYWKCPLSSTEFLHVREPSALSDKYLPDHKVMISNRVILSQITGDPETGALKLVNSTDISTMSGLRVTSSLIFLAFLSWVKCGCNSTKLCTIFQQG